MLLFKEGALNPVDLEVDVGSMIRRRERVFGDWIDSFRLIDPLS